MPDYSYAGINYDAGDAMQHDPKLKAETRAVREPKTIRREYQTPCLQTAARLSAVTSVGPILSGIPVA